MLQSSGADKKLDSGFDDVFVLSPGGFLLNNTSSYAKGQTKHFDFKLKTTCSPPLQKSDPVQILKFTACANGGGLESDPCGDSDITPDKSPNVVVTSVKLHK